ncbi:unnamed protein product [Blepharisma stoltei]|uniref:Uncharacterized protein n=1 Tax=Blepharisma stoltei TaxID=1481888 RepID=A0AAU9IPJ6_9CILI|nr:unnamed protein product [Blepharisma stoltei]
MDSHAWHALVGCFTCTDITYQKYALYVSWLYFLSLTGQCLSKNPTEYTSNSVTNNCDFSTNLVDSLNLANQVYINTVSIFNISIVITNIYPDWSDLHSLHWCNFKIIL